MHKSYLDNTRTGVVLLVVLYHVFYMFNAVTPGVVGPVGGPAWLDAVEYLLYPWFMVILFLVSGICARYYLAAHTGKEFFRARTRKLLVPSTIGVLLLGWAQGYINMQLSHIFDALPTQIPPVVLYLIECLSGIGVLWTAQVLWVCALVLLAVRKVEKGCLARLGVGAGIAVLVLLGVPVWFSAQVLTAVIPVYRFGIYIFVFLLGYFVFCHEEVMARLQQYALPLLAAALVLGIAYTVRSFGQNYAMEPNVNSPLAIAYGWLMCLAVLGCMKRYADRPIPFLSFWHRRSFGLYVFHYLPLSATAWLLAGHTQLSAVVLYLSTAAAAYGGGLALYEIVSRIPGLRWCLLGLRTPKE